MRSDRREVRQERTRQAIVEAARAVFARQGVEATTLAEIAEEAGYGVSSLYSYFENKEQLVNSAIDAFVVDAFAILDRERGDDEPFLPWFERLVRDQFALAFASRGLIGVLSEMRDEAKGRPGVQGLDAERWLRRLAEILEDGMDCGALRRMDPMLAAHLTEGALHAIACAHASELPTRDDDELIEVSLQFLFEGLGQSEESA